MPVQGKIRRLKAVCGLFLIFALIILLPHGTARAQLPPPNCEVSTVGSITANSLSIALGASTTLRWFFDGPNDCPLWVNGQSVPTGQSGSKTISPQTKTTYIFTTIKLDGSQRQLGSVEVAVTPDCATSVSANISALPRTVHTGGKSTLSWLVTAPPACQLDLKINGITVGKAGNLSVQPSAVAAPCTNPDPARACYDLTTSLSGAPQTIKTVEVAVNSSVCRVDDNSDESKDKLVKCLGEDGSLVILGRNVDMDLTGYEQIYIRESVTLTGDDGNPPRPVRNARELGPRLFTRFRPKPQFQIVCNSDGSIVGNNVRMSGFRLHGPHYGIMDGGSNLERAIHVESCLNVEISNMELAGWSGQAIYIAENPQVPTSLKPGSVYIHDNYIHNNQHVGENGYGVAVSAGAYARVERNVFDLNRHALEASGDAGTGYQAKNNLVLKGGGVHGTFFNSYTHQFDVHGNRNCPPVFSSIWNCGRAGDRFSYFDNTFQYTRDRALKLRGRPFVGASIGGNVFAHSRLIDTTLHDGAVELFTETNVHLGTGAQRNVANYDTYGRYSVCDLDGDKKDDLFLASGRTWWMMSAARMHWVFLKAATERLEDVGLGDFNGDGRCDVLAPNGDTWEISSGGSGAWTALPGTYPVPFKELRFADFNGDGRTDVFRRDGGGQWSVVSPGIHGWKNLQSSSFALSDLRFGDFTGDGRADVLSQAGGHWSISKSGAGAWIPLNSLSTGFGSILIADVNGDGTDDIVRFKVTSATKGTWEVSWGGQTGWRPLRTVTVPPPPAPPQTPLVLPRIFAGNFDNLPGDDLLHIDYKRVGRLFDYAKATLVTHNLFPY